MERGPVFVAGSERSGTSLMYALLASHPNIAMTRRTNLWTYFYGRYGDLSRPEHLERCIDTMMRYKRIAVLRIDPERLRLEFLRGEPTYARLFALVEMQHAERVGKPRWGDKSLGTERYATPILAGYGGARIVHMIRDPRDRYASVATRWGSRRGGLGAGTAEWLSSARLGLRHQRRYPDRYRVLRYESLVTDPEGTLRDLCGFIGEEYAPEMLSMDGAASFRDAGANSSYGKRASEAVTPDSIGRFRTVLSPEQVAFIQASAGRSMRKLDYDLDALHLDGRSWVRAWGVTAPVEAARLLGWMARDAWRDRTGRTLPAYRYVTPEAAR